MANFFERFKKIFTKPIDKKSLARTKSTFAPVLAAFARNVVDERFWDELEEALYKADIGHGTMLKLVDRLKQRTKREHFQSSTQILEALKQEFIRMLGPEDTFINLQPPPKLTTILVVGVNGVGKTTSIAKMSKWLQDGGFKVTIAAGDTFRAAAVEQIKIWGDRLGVQVVNHQQDADASAVVYDAMRIASKDVPEDTPIALIVDTAGRLHTKFNLMEELKKITKVVKKHTPDAPHEVLLVIDAPTGQNALAQAMTFVKDVGVTGVILTKLDGTSKGGIIFAIADELKLPIKFIGTGEKVDDFAKFDSREFVTTLFEQ